MLWNYCKRAEQSWSKPMTPEQLDKIDRLVAEKVMGWEVVPAVLNPKAGDAYGEHGVRLRPVKSWQPTRNIAQAFEVWEELAATGIYCCMNINNPIHEGWEVSLKRV